MNIGIDARKIRDFGIGAYIKNLIRHIPDYDRTNRYVIFHYPEDRAFIPLTGPNLTLIPDNSPKYSLHELITLPVKMHTQKLDLFHAPHYTLPPIRPCRGVVTIHDVIHLRFPEYLPQVAFYYAKLMMWAAARSAKKIITVSEYSKQDIVRYLGVPEEKIVVIYNGINQDVTHGQDAEAQKPILKERLGISPPYILYLGNFLPHKNINMLIKAYGLLKQQHAIPHRLVLAGKNDKMRSQLQELISQERLEQDVILPGFVEPEFISPLYAQADLFVTPSLYEGFGLQVLEAMAHHTPVAISEVASLPEIAGDAAIRFDPQSAENMADAIYHGLSDQQLRRKLLERGQARLSHFSWQTMAQRTIEVYQTILSFPGAP